MQYSRPSPSALFRAPASADRYHGACMRDAGTSTETGRYALCANLVWESSPKSGEVVPGRYCVNRLGVVAAVDCPVYQGLSCCLFESRGRDASPAPVTDEELEEIRGALTVDFLRWPYWRRIELLRRAEPPEPLNPLPDIEVKEEDEGDIPDTETVRIETVSREEEALQEKYPGQRRSEDRRRENRPAEPAPESPPDDVPAAESADAPAESPDDASEAPPPRPDQRPDETAKPRRSRRRRRGGRGRRRSRGREKGDPPAGDAKGS